MPPALNMPPAPKWWASHLSHASSPTPGHILTLTLCKEPARPTSGSEQGSLLLVFAPLCCSRGPSKAGPEFLVRTLINFYLLGKVKNPGRYLLLHCPLQKFTSFVVYFQLLSLLLPSASKYFQVIFSSWSEPQEQGPFVGHRHRMHRKQQYMFVGLKPSRFHVYYQYT